ncbi:hypothetical protein KRX57_09740 [Weeksellaceae bacterium TAE3-ERU29]|nr:hypothetical protein [Weeksellaceae bacterium TAE3-ERU29]
MAIDGVKIIDGDLAHDTYEAIMELYDSGANAEMIKKEIPFTKEDYGINSDFYHEIFVTAYALAFWEIGEITDEILNEVKHVIALKAGVKLWTEECNEKEGNKRQRVLDRFLKKISKPNQKIRKRKKYRVVKNLYFEQNDVLTFKLSDDNYCSVICVNITQNKSQTTYDLALTTYKRKEKPTIEVLKNEFLVSHLIESKSTKKEILESQPGVDILWEYHKNNAQPMTQAQKDRTYSDSFIEIFEGRKQNFIFSIPFTLVTHKDMTPMKDRFEVIGKLKVKESFNSWGGIHYLSTFEKIEDYFSNLDEETELFRKVKFPIKLLCEI